MDNGHRVFLTAFPGLVLMLQTMGAFPSGSEGEALVEPDRRGRTGCVPPLHPDPVAAINNSGR